MRTSHSSETSEMRCEACCSSPSCERVWLSAAVTMRWPCRFPEDSTVNSLQSTVNELPVYTYNSSALQRRFFGAAPHTFYVYRISTKCWAAENIRPGPKNPANLFKRSSIMYCCGMYALKDAREPGLYLRCWNIFHPSVL